ncbi:phage protein [Hafnia paralvei ATCC 29927]|uniref:BRCT domain-containing protein n=1 Tax=Hafnia paralvei TaxID=546367 RepID=UPI0007E46D27|nr:BRCT domain-containing protein [Hafnia paralvei]MDU1190551.1 BRCT domain-containing protein [Enterobacteriaceae bacterium]MDU1243400.1 BRCT domain-containing protein [Enterobacteriaceae bacterium]OAT40381.1 phage protein [Hafnia paralvei ATCC 29927]TBM03278.1 hypothetical protein EYY87_14240 [Hafnia paralvei]HCU16710.1 hypothetical protein [Hafnia paralvei]
MASRIFLYVNSNKQIRVQHIHDVTENDTYFQGISLLDSEHGKLKTFRKDRVIQDLDSLPEDEEIYIRDIDVTRYFPSKKIKETFDVCFTGFKKDQRAELEQLAADNGMLVRKSVTQKLQILCCGDNAGPTKVRSARDMNILIFDAHQFINLINTGELEINQ